jgi:hypothetical protein
MKFAAGIVNRKLADEFYIHVDSIQTHFTWIIGLISLIFWKVTLDTDN